MKKIFAIVMTLAMILSLGTIFASAETLWVTDKDTFQPVGDVEIKWDPKVSEKLDLSDGRMDDWAAAGYSPIQINPENMVSWVGTSENMPAGWNISTYFVADKDYLYIGFFITDPNVVFGTNPDAYNSDGDSFQIMVDFSGKLQDMMINRPDDYAALSNGKCIFYSFDCDGDGSPLYITRQESDNNGVLSEANGDGVKGTGGKTETGWCAEFALSWEMLYEDYAWKAYEDDMKIYFGGKDNKRLDCGIALYYLNMDASGGGITWAAGTANGEQTADGAPVLNWDPKDCGIHLYLEYQDGLEFSCENLVVLGPTETEPPTEEKTEEPTEPATDPVTEAPTDAPETEAKTEAQTEAKTEAKTDAPKEEGCGAVIGMSAVAVLVAAAAAVVLKKKD